RSVTRLLYSPTAESRNSTTTMPATARIVAIELSAKSTGMRFSLPGEIEHERSLAGIAGRGTAGSSHGVARYSANPAATGSRRRPRGAAVVGPHCAAWG